ncbi:MAG: O-antigen ligase family protein [Candidatus Pacebacteria bacterium]|nr:O-antigen ligase family protein [Candidatus Paceibacterota bacterium]
MSISFKTIFLFELMLVFAMVIGIAPQEFSYLILLLLTISFIKLSLLDSLKLFILSIPFFVALPANAISDSMSIWRILIVVLVIKVGYEKYCHSVRQLEDSDSINNKDFICFQFVKQNIKKIVNIDSYKQKIFNSPTGGQNDSYYKLFFLIILFFIIAAASLISAQDIGMGIKKILFLLNIFLLFPIVNFVIQKENDLIEILKTVLYCSVMVVFMGYFQFFLTFFVTLSKFWYFWTDNVIKVFYGQNLSHLLSYSNTWFSYYEVLPPTLRMFSVMPDSHSFAMFIVVLMPVVLSFLFLPPLVHTKNRITNKKYLSLMLIFFLLAIFFSGSRGAWVASIFALLASVYLFLVSSEKIKNNSKIEKIRLIISEFVKLLKSKVGFGFNAKNNSKYYSKLIAFSVLLFFVLMPVSSLILKQNQETQLMRNNISLSDYDRSKFSMFERAFSISDFDEISNKGRIQIWQETIASIKKRPLLGVGFGNFNYVLGENMLALKKGSSAHSIYLDIAAEIGIFGLIISLFLIMEILKMSYKLYFCLEKKYLKIFAGSFFVYFTWVCAYGIFDVVIFNDKVLILVVILLGVLCSIKKSFDFSKT